MLEGELTIGPSLRVSGPFPAQVLDLYKWLSKRWKSTTSTQQISHKLQFCLHLHRFVHIAWIIPVYSMVNLIRIYPLVFHKFPFCKAVSTISANEEVLKRDFCLSVFLELYFNFFFFSFPPDKSNAKLPRTWIFLCVYKPEKQMLGTRDLTS